MKLNENGLLPLWLSYVVPATLANSFLAFYFLTDLKTGLYGLLAFYAVTFGVGGLLVARQGPISIRSSFTIAAMLIVGELALVGFPLVANQWLLAAPVYGGLMMFFWTTYNTLHFRQQEQKNNATRSAYYWTVIWLTAVLLPLMGTIIIHASGFHGLYATAILLSLPLAWMARKQTDKAVRFDFLRFWKDARGYRTLAFLEGALSAMPLAILPALSVLYFPTPVGFGIYTALVALAGMVAAILLARHSDALNKRKRFLGPVSMLSAIGLAGAAFAMDVVAWTAASAAFSFFYALSSPLRIAVILDKEHRAQAAMSVREFLLNAGRVVALVLGGLLLTVATPQDMLWPGVLSAAAYALLLWKKEWMS